MSYRPATDPFDGLLLLDKPAGPTSHDMVDRIRRHFRLNKVGHGGTLDPQATGLLVLMIGRATKLADTLMAGNKTYEGVIRLGRTTDSQDAQGAVLSEADFSQVTQTQLLEQMNKLTGDVMQTPPMVSAIKQNGVPLYKLARKGQVVERKPKLVRIYTFTLKDFTPPTALFEVTCSKGVYVRTLCADIGEALGCGAILDALRRTRSGDFKINEAHTLEALLKLNLSQLADLMIPLNRIHLQTGQRTE